MRRILITLVILVLLTVYVSGTHAAVFTVTNLSDGGLGSLRQAVIDANTLGGADTITFTVSGTIALTSGQINITDSVVIDGSGQNVTISGSNLSRVLQTSAGITVELRNLTIIAGNPIFQGGAILNDGTLTVTNSTFTNNIGSFGGAIFNSGSVTITGSTFSGNVALTAATGGGAIYNNFGTLLISNSTFSGNQAAGDGGAIASGGTVTISNSTFSGNQAARSGGGIISIIGTLTIDSSTISGNIAAAQEAGGIYSSDILNMTNSTVSGNSAGTNGGGLLSANATINSSTIVNNSAANGANVYVPFNLTTTTISASIINGGSCTVGAGGVLTDGGNNLQFNAPGCPGMAADPLLQPLANYGGATQTHALGVGSAAFDAYTVGCPATDQRGVARPQGAACDIGAFEGQYAPSPVPGGAPVLIIPTLPPPPQCQEMNESAFIVPPGMYCQILMRNGAWVNIVGTLPEGIVDLGVIIALEVVYYDQPGHAAPNFANDAYQQICLFGEGRFLYADGRNVPRTYAELETTFENGCTCAWIAAPGTVALVEH